MKSQELRKNRTRLRKETVFSLSFFFVSPALSLFSSSDVSLVVAIVFGAMFVHVSCLLQLPSLWRCVSVCWHHDA